eukprot:gene79-398_t
MSLRAPATILGLAVACFSATSSVCVSARRVEWGRGNYFGSGGQVAAVPADVEPWIVGRDGAGVYRGDPGGQVALQSWGEDRGAMDVAVMWNGVRARPLMVDVEADTILFFLHFCRQSSCILERETTDDVVRDGGGECGNCLRVGQSSALWTSRVDDPGVVDHPEDPGRVNLVGQGWVDQTFCCCRFCGCLGGGKEGHTCCGPGVNVVFGLVGQCAPACCHTHCCVDPPK